jgi:hypothetical protein
VPRLRWLLLTEITDAGVPYMNLECLSVREERISEKNLSRLNKVRPG